MVSTVKLITNEMVKQVLKYKDLIPAVEQGMKEYSAGKVLQPVRSTLNLEKHNGYFFSMPAYSCSQDVLAVKHIGLYPDNPAKNLPSHLCQLLLFDAEKGGLLALMDADEITEMRTAAASAVATKYLAVESPKVLAVLGAGNQAYSHIMALSSQHTFDKILIWNRTPENGRKLCRKVESVAQCVTYCASVENAVKDADIIVTVTTSPTPVLSGRHLKDGVHINCVGAARPHWRELDDGCMSLCDLYVDSRDGALTESGDVIHSKKEILAEVGEVAAGKATADRNKRTIFKSLGMAIEDAVSADLVWRKVKLGE